MIKPRGNIVFTFLLFSLTVTLSILTVNMGRVASLIPVWVVIPTAGILAFQLLLDLVPMLKIIHEKWEKREIFEIEKIRQRTPTLDETSPPQNTHIRRQLAVFLWVLLLIGLIYLLGFLVALPLYMLLYLRLFAKESWTFTLSMAAGTWVVVYGGFVFILHANLYQGLLRLWWGT